MSLDKYFGDTANVKFGRLTASARPLFRAPRPDYEKATISIEFKYHSTQKASYRIKRGLIHILRGYILKLIATGIFYGFLNTVEPLGTDTFLIRTPLYYGQFPMSRQNSHLFSLKKTSITVSYTHLTLPTNREV